MIDLTDILKQDIRENMKTEPREIIFRGMSIHGQWHEGSLHILPQDIVYNNVKFEKGLYISNKHGMPLAYSVRPETIGQFTGLETLTFNREGGYTKLFEGDICNYNYYIHVSPNPDANPIEYNGRGVIEYMDGAFVCRDIKNKHTYPLFFGELSLVKIGNIHKYPELLNY